MNGALVLGFARQRLTSPVRLVLFAFLFGMPLLLGAAAPALGLQPFRDISGLILLFAAGVIGQDVSSGVLHLLLARPVSRAEYVASRWFAAGSLAASAALIQLALGCAILAARGAAPDAAQAGLLAGEHMLRCFGVAAVIVLLSSFMGGIGDLGIYFVAAFTALIAAQVGPSIGMPWLATAGLELQRFLSPAVDLAGLAHGEALAKSGVVPYLSTVTLCLGLAIVVMNRKELTYASG